MTTPSNDSINPPLPGDLDRCKECGVEHFIARTGIDHDAWGAAMFNLGEQKLRADRAEADRDRMRWTFEAAKRWVAARDHITIDEGDFATKLHHTHACQHCGMVWRPAVEPTVGVRFLPGFKNGER